MSAKGVWGKQQKETERWIRIFKGTQKLGTTDRTILQAMPTRLGVKKEKKKQWDTTKK